MTEIDITIALKPGTPEWPGDTPYSCGWAWSKAAGASVNVSTMTMSPHVGTHADAPLHVEDGWPGPEGWSLGTFRGRCAVVEAGPDPKWIDPVPLLASAEGGFTRVLVRTGRSIASGVFPESWPVLDLETARTLVARGVRLLGIDAPSWDDRESKDLPVHHILLAAGVVLVENLDLSAVRPGEWELVSMPMRVEGVDAAPVRAVVVGRVGDAGHL